jgi:hypothetical protein
MKTNSILSTMKIIVLLVLLISFFMACRKEETIADPLSKFRLKEYTHNHYKYAYVYDSINRLNSSSTYFDDNLVYTTHYFYNGNTLDSLIERTATITPSYETFR